MKSEDLDALDLAVALADGWKHLGAIGVNHRNDEKPYCLTAGVNDWWESPDGDLVCGPCYGIPYRYSRDRAEAMRLLEKYGLAVWCAHGGWRSQVSIAKGDGQLGETPCIAICKAVIALTSASPAEAACTSSSPASSREE